MQHRHSGRDVRVGEAPTLSILVTSTADEARLRGCLTELLPVCEGLSAQLVVARTGSEDEIAQLTGAFPTIRFIVVPPGSGVAELREAGMAEADGDIVVLGEDGRLTAAELYDRFVPGRRNT